MNNYGKSLLILVLLSALSSMAFAQTRATTEDGRAVILHENGRWEFAGENDPGNGLVTLELLIFQWHESGADNDYANDFSDWFDMVFVVRNESSRSVRAAKGTVVFEDLFGDEIWRVGLQLSDPLEPEEETQWHGSVDYQMFDETHRRLKNMDERDMPVRFVDVQVIQQEYPEHSISALSTLCRVGARSRLASFSGTSASTPARDKSRPQSNRRGPGSRVSAKNAA